MLLLFLFPLVDFISQLVIVIFLTEIDLLFKLILSLLVNIFLFFFLLSLSILDHLFSLLMVSIPFTSLQNVLSFLSCLIYLFSCLVFFIHQQIDSVLQKLSVLLSSFSFNFGFSKLFIELVHVVIGINIPGVPFMFIVWRFMSIWRRFLR